MHVNMTAWDRSGISYTRNYRTLPSRVGSAANSQDWQMWHIWSKYSCRIVVLQPSSILSELSGVQSFYTHTKKKEAVETFRMLYLTGILNVQAASVGITVQG
jgi:hypothetical protein